MADQQPTDDPTPPEEDQRNWPWFHLPDWDWRVPFVARAKVHEGKPKYVRTKEMHVPEAFSDPDRILPNGNEKVNLVDTHRKGDTYVSVDHSARNKVAKGVKGISKLNLLGALADVGNFAYENRDKFDTVEQFLNEYGDDVVEGVQYLADEAWQAIQDNDLSKIFELGINSVVPISSVTRAADNVADWLGFDTDFTADTAKFVHDATKDSPILEGLSDVWHNAVETFNDNVDLSPVDNWYTENVAKPVQDFANSAGEAVGNAWHEFTSLFK